MRNVLKKVNRKFVIPSAIFFAVVGVLVVKDKNAPELYPIAEGYIPKNETLELNQQAIDKAVTIQADAHLAESYSFQKVMGLVTDAGSATEAIRLALQGCVAAQSIRIENKNILNPVDIQKISLTKAHQEQPIWQELEQKLDRFRLVAIAPRLKEPPVKTSLIKIVYELGPENRSPDVYDQGFSIFLMPVFTIKLERQNELASDLRKMSEGQLQTEAFMQKWVTKENFSSLRSSCTANKSISEDWVWYELMYSRDKAGKLNAFFVNQQVPLVEKDASAIVPVVSFLGNDDRFVPNTDHSLRRSMIGSFTCAQCHVRRFSHHVLADEADPNTKRELPILSLMSFFSHLSLNANNPYSPVMKSRFQLEWERYQLELVNSIGKLTK